MFDELTQRDEHSPLMRASTMRKQTVRFSDLRDAFYGTDNNGALTKAKTSAFRDAQLVSRPTLINEVDEEAKS